MRTELVGIVNVTPDSFSDGGESFLPEAALMRIQACFDEGASVVDVGAQSTRPGAQMLTAQEEWQRLAEILPDAVRVARECGGCLSVDTFYPEVAHRALAAGVTWINDVMGLESQSMIEAVRESDCKLVVMHSLGIPPNPAFMLEADVDPVQFLLRYFHERKEKLLAEGIREERLIFDPGIGFGKSPTQSLTLLLRARELDALDTPLLWGHSRKSFLKLFSAVQPQERDDLTLAFSSLLAASGAHYLRVHNVLRHAALLAAMDANLPHH